jgi:hypothetical protein
MAVTRRRAVTARIVFCFGSILWSASCSDSPTEPRGDSVEVRSAVPAAGTALTVGAQVGFTYQVTFSLTSNSALVGIMVIPVVGGISLFPDSAPPTSTILRGITTVALSDTLTIPPGCTRVDVFIAMQNQDRIGQTSTVISYPVRDQIQ